MQQMFQKGLNSSWGTLTNKLNTSLYSLPLLRLLADFFFFPRLERIKKNSVTKWQWKEYNNNHDCLLSSHGVLYGPGCVPAAAAAKLLQSCPTLCDPVDGSPPGFPVPGILQARTLEWVAISFSNAWKWKVKVKSLSRVGLFATPCAAAHQAPLSMGFSRQEYWSGCGLDKFLNKEPQYLPPLKRG